MIRALRLLPPRRPAALRALLHRHASTTPLLGDGDGAVAPGQIATMRRTFSSEDVAGFARISGDHNPIHGPGTAAARAAGFDGPICHGLLYSSLIGTLFAQRVPGVLYVSQELNFLLPVYPGEEVEVEIEVLQVHRKGFVQFRTALYKDGAERGGGGEGGAERVTVLEGEGKVRLPPATR